MNDSSQPVAKKYFTRRTLTIFSGKILTVDNMATFLLYHTPTLVCPNECTIGFFAPHKQSV